MDLNADRLGSDAQRPAFFLRKQQVKARACRRSGMKSWGS